MYDVDCFPSHSDIERFVLSMSPQDYEEFHDLLQPSISNFVCEIIGEALDTTDAANDPIFLLNIAMVDYILDTRQSRSLAHLAAHYATDYTALVLIVMVKSLLHSFMTIAIFAEVLLSALLRTLLEQECIRLETVN